MCNTIHPENIPIKKEGFGYKIFRKHDFVLIGPFSKAIYFKRNKKIVKWKEDEYGDGFCFLSNKRKAFKLMSQLYYCNELVLHKISYKKGLTKQLEVFNQIRYFNCLCKEFKLLEEIKK